MRPRGFRDGTRGIDLDPLARRALWEHGLDYDHGTGHGVGSYLSVHEGPQSISKAGMAPLLAGMICSNEPGYYKEGAYGIRIENLVLVTEPATVAGRRPRNDGIRDADAGADRPALIVKELLAPDRDRVARRLSRARFETLSARPRSPRHAAGSTAATAPL